MIKEALEYIVNMSAPHTAVRSCGVDSGFVAVVIRLACVANIPKEPQQYTAGGSAAVYSQS